MFRTITALVVVGLGVVNAQSLSSQCQAALLTVVGSPEASCLNVGGLIPILTGTTNNQSLVPPVNTWLEGACAESPCSNQALSDIVTNVTNGCGNELSSIGFSNSSVPDVISAVQQAYPTVRSIACLKETSNNTLCITTMLDQIQQVEGSLSVDTIESLVPQIVMGTAQGLPSYITCSDCVKQAYNVLNSTESSIASSTQVQSALQSQCGSSFTDGNTPSDIAEGTGSAAPTGTGTTLSSSGAVGLSYHGAVGTAFASLSVVFGAFVVLV